MPREDATASRAPRTALVGLGNPFHGHDAVGLVLARSVHQSLRPPQAVDLLEPAASGFALADPGAETGAVRRLDAAECFGRAPLSPHTRGFHEGLAMGRAVGLPVPSAIALYGIVIREPLRFAEGLSRELESRLPAIVASIAGAEFAASRERPEGGPE